MTRARKTAVAKSPALAPAVATPPAVTRKPRPVKRRSYEGADMGRLLGEWNPAADSANPQVYMDLATLRNRSRDLLRNNPLAVKGIQSMVSAVIGGGIHPQAVTGNEAMDKRIMQAWAQWQSGELDTAHDRTWAALQTLWVRGWLESGGVFIRKRPRRLSDGFAVPLQLQTLEADFCDLFKNYPVGDSGGHVTMGVQFDAVGRREGYWLYRQHPGESLPMLNVPTFSAVFVEADRCAYLTMPERPGQVHGVPWVAPAMRTLWDLAAYNAAEMVRKRTEACMAAFVVPGDESYSTDSDQEGAGPSVETSDGTTLDRMEPGTIGILRGGKDIKFSQPSNNSQWDSYIRTQHRLVAAGMRVPYERLTTDLGQVNYSSYRAGDLEFRRLVMTLQRQVVIPLVCQQVWGWFIEALGVLDPTIPAKVPVKWHCPRFEELDREKELKADALAVANGFASPSQVVAEHGGDYGDTIAQWKVDMDAAKKAGLPFAWLAQSSPATETVDGGGQ
jgi:lambda family phage portal protein